MTRDQKETETGLCRTWGILLLVLCLFITLSLFSYDWEDINLLKAPHNDPPSNLIGPAGAWLSFALFVILGVGAYLIPVWCLVIGLILIFSKANRLWPKVVWGVILILTLTAILELREASWASTCRKLNISNAGGIFSQLITSGLLVRWFSPVGTGILAWSVFLIALVMLIGIQNIGTGCRYLVVYYRLMVERFRNFVLEHQDKHHRIEREERVIEKRRRRLEEKILRQEHLASIKPKPLNQEDEPVEAVKERASTRKPERIETEEKPAPGKSAVYELPPLSLLGTGPIIREKAVKTDTATMSRILTETLAEFGIEAEVTNVEKGPV